MKNFLFVFCFSVFLMRSSLGVQETYFNEQKLDVPGRDTAIIVGDEGFYPNRVVVFKGEKVKFFITNTTEQTQCFNIPDKNLFTTAQKGKIAEGETFFDKSGVYTFNCPNFKFTGRIIVIEKEADRKETMRRGLANETVKVWKPKDEPSEWVEISREDFKKKFGDIMDLDN